MIFVVASFIKKLLLHFVWCTLYLFGCYKCYGVPQGTVCRCWTSRVVLNRTVSRATNTLRPATTSSSAPTAPSPWSSARTGCCTTARATCTTTATTTGASSAATGRLFVSTTPCEYATIGSGTNIGRCWITGCHQVVISTANNNGLKV